MTRGALCNMTLSNACFRAGLYFPDTKYSIRAERDEGLHYDTDHGVQFRGGNRVISGGQGADTDVHTFRGTYICVYSYREIEARE